MNHKLQLYRFACVLLAVLAAEQGDPDFASVSEELERLFLPSDAFENRKQLLFVRNAMLELADLIWPEGKPRPIPWARRWLRRAGAHESNRALLATFALRWSYQFAAVSRVLRDSQVIS